MPLWPNSENVSDFLVHVWKVIIRFVERLCLAISSFLVKRFNCKRCRKSYRHQASLHHHTNYECGVAPKFACEMCAYVGKRKHHLQSHYKYSHKLIFISWIKYIRRNVRWFNALLNFQMYVLNLNWKYNIFKGCMSFIIFKPDFCSFYRSWVENFHKYRVCQHTLNKK